MIEILFICLVVWIIYAWKTGKFKKEYQNKNNAKLKQEWGEIKDQYKNGLKINVQSKSSSKYRYNLEYLDRFGSPSVREVNIIIVHKYIGNNRWYFLAETEDGERTFKSQRVICLTDQWNNRIFDNSSEIRNHLLSEYEVSENDFYED